MQKLQSFVEAGNTTLTITGAVGTIARKVQGSFPSATVTVYKAGTTTVASIYADNGVTVKANPFTAAADGTWFFYAANGRYDVKFSGGGISTPFTLGDFSLFDETSLHVNVQDSPYNAVGDGVADDGPAIQAAIDSLTSGGIVYFPLGNYNYTTALVPALGVSYEGVGGEVSVLQPSGCHAFDFSGLASTFGEIEFSKLGINGTNCTAKTTFYQASLVELWGVHIHDCLITNYNCVIQTQSTRNWWVHDNWFQHINSAIVLLGFNAVWRIRDNQIITGNGCGSASTDFDSDGIKLGYSGLLKPESAHVSGNQFHGFKRCINLSAAIGTNIIDNDFDAIIVAVQFGEAVGLNVTNNLIAMRTTTATQAILGTSQASVLTTKINIKNNYCIGDGTTTTCLGFQADSAVTQNQCHIVLEGNFFASFNSYDIALYNMGNIDVISNECYSTGIGTSIYVPATLLGRIVNIDRNFCVGTINAPFGSQLAQIFVGSTGGTFSTLIRGRSVITNPATTVTTTYASLLGAGGIPNFDTVAHTGFNIVGVALNSDDRNIGAISLVPAVNQVVINIGTTPAVATVIDWEVRLVQRYN